MGTTWAQPAPLQDPKSLRGNQMNNHAKSLRGLLVIFTLLVLSTALFGVLAGPDPQPAQGSVLRRRTPTPTRTPTSIWTATPTATPTAAGTSTPTPMPGPNGVWNIVASP